MRRSSSLPSLPPLRPLLAIPLALALGCADPDFNQPELLKLPRILAMQAEPPQPSYGTATTLRALIYQPDDRPHADECMGASDPGPKYEWSWCPLPTSSSNGFECPLKDPAQLDLLFAAFGLGPAPSLHLGTGETATLTNPFPASLLYRLCLPPLDPTLAALLGLPPAAVSADPTASPLGCDMPNLSDPDPAHPLGYPVTVMLKYTPPCGSPPQEKYGDILTAVFAVHLPTDDTLPPNQNPVVGDIFAISAYSKALAPSDAAPLPNDPPAPIDAGVADGGAGGAVDAGETIDGGAAFDGATAAADASPPTADVALAAQPPDSGMPPVPVNLALLPRQERVGLWLDMPDSNAELLVRTGKLDEVQAEDKKNGIPAKVLHFERLSLLWFAEAGDFGAQHGNLGRRSGFQSTPDRDTFTPADEDAMDRARQVVWALPYKEDYESDRARVVVVIRDSRGGVAWAQAVATLEPEP